MGEVADWDDMVDVPRWHQGQSIQQRECRDASCRQLHWTLHADEPLVITSRPTAAEALQRASEEMRT